MTHNCGVYQIRNVTNNKRYIGSTNDLRGRWRKHKLSLFKDAHHSIKLQRAWNKANENDFVFEVLLYCDPENCLMYEQIALDGIKPAYNVCKIADAPMTGRKHSAKTKVAISKSLRGNKYALGYKHTEETKARISKTNLLTNIGEKNGWAKLSNSDVITIKVMLSCGYSCTELGKEFGVSKSTISAIKLGKRRKNA
jgi:group I intron endonuclease